MKGIIIMNNDTCFHAPIDLEMIDVYNISGDGKYDMKIEDYGYVDSSSDDDYFYPYKSPIYYCPHYNAYNTSNATRNTVDCSIRVCPSMYNSYYYLDIYSHDCIGDQYLRLEKVNSNHSDEVGSNDDQSQGNYCSRMTYSAYFDGNKCETFDIKQGCYSDNSCSGTVIVYDQNFVLATTSIPTSSPTPSPTNQADKVGRFYAIGHGTYSGDW